MRAAISRRSLAAIIIQRHRSASSLLVIIRHHLYHHHHCHPPTPVPTTPRLYHPTTLSPTLLSLPPPSTLFTTAPSAPTFALANLKVSLLLQFSFHISYKLRPLQPDALSNLAAVTSLDHRISRHPTYVHTSPQTSPTATAAASLDRSRHPSDTSVQVRCHAAVLSCTRNLGPCAFVCPRARKKLTSLYI